MPRQLDDWLRTYCEWTSHTEAPRIFHFWSGVCAIAGALRRRVWVDRLTFTWYPSFYVILVAPPGIANKSITVDLAGGLLRGVPGIRFGPDSVTWQSLVTSFAGACEQFLLGDTFYPMSAMTIVSSELGLLLNMQDRDMVNLLITLWDGRKSLEKQTKLSGNDSVEAPWLTLLGCTTPKAIAENMPPSAVGGGFTSRCIFVMRGEKAQIITNPAKGVRRGAWERVREGLLEDLVAISNLGGEFVLTPQADRWEDEWYNRLWKETYPRADSEIVQGYLARKQTHLIKLSMVMAVSRSDRLVIEVEDLQAADLMLLEVEGDLERVFEFIGKSSTSIAADRLLAFIQRKGSVRYEEAYSVVHASFPNFREFENILSGAIHSGKVLFDVGTKMLHWRAKGEQVSGG